MHPRPVTPTPLCRPETSPDRNAEINRAALGLITCEDNTAELITRALQDDDGHEALYWLLNRKPACPDQAELQNAVLKVARRIAAGVEKAKPAPVTEPSLYDHQTTANVDEGSDQPVTVSITYGEPPEPACGTYPGYAGYVEGYITTADGRRLEPEDLPDGQWAYLFAEAERAYGRAQAGG